MTQPLAIYIHWPYCQSKCPYCDFNSFVGGAVDQSNWREAYRRELKYYAALLPDRRVTSVFFGGGTPSLMEPATVASALENIAAFWPVDEQVEITLEANPGSAEAEKFAGFRAAGVNRLSLGVQALRDDDLRFLGRAHSVVEARQAMELARQNFPRFSFDLIYARRGQTPAMWEEELHEALALAGGHLSLYQLTIEPNTTFFTRTARGEKLTAEENPSVEMFEQTQAIMRDASLPAYEISNHALPGQESRHNLTYWRYDDYIGIGPGAHGRYCTDRQKVASDNHRSPETWMQSVMEHGQGQRAAESLDSEAAMREALMMGLRLVEGIDRQAWAEKFGMDIATFLPEGRLRSLLSEGLLQQNQSSLLATASGLQRLNSVLTYVLP